MSLRGSNLPGIARLNSPRRGGRERPKQSHKALKAGRLPRLRAETSLRRAGTLPSVARNDEKALRHTLSREGDLMGCLSLSD
jgi:hypothetical protein